MDLSTLKKLKGNIAREKRVGRGVGSGHGGHTSGRGSKGQKSRTGGKVRPGFEGGQNPLYKRLPQIGGFRNKGAKERITVSLSVFSVFRAGTVVTPQKLLDAGIIKSIPKGGVKILAGTIPGKKLKLDGFHMSESVKKKLGS
ncbi:MAG: 50S ribosomal protein L15 [candidate division WWE3 bacterium GW2011_GWA1_46_21]|uniref:Large ribosomal subunit protein uL15 n=3 Tax=Katanobacteria TaxID=422282 RepID=A0A0G1RQF0_UNCKA|nr:MAG: 50S ribosomal protein L15 [candidate division WWE3 bacterium GW2011_GWA1_46_21]KKU49147.1 MAG: 50S ribosomal protein L15 [candidate division WWE3 bacterium GW2011_GWA2_46_9]KKU58134.1 MAG: 50S ribosomal protein L15 [candidate division WWE3 bacterium GW2011_GWB1_47_11]